MSLRSRQQLAVIDLHFHDLRREFGSRMIEAGVGLAAVRDLLGHPDVSVTDRYLATDGMRLQEAIKKLDASIIEVVSAPRPKDQPPNVM